MFEITQGKISGAQKVVVYGPEGIGKSTFASKFPAPLFIDTEGSTRHMDVARLPRPSSWTMLMQEVYHVRDMPGLCSTLVIDTADWAEQRCIEHICANRLPPKGKEINGIEDFGFGKGYTYLAEEFGRLLNLLEEVIARGINVTLCAHAAMRKFEQPDEMGAYDRWEMKLGKKTAPLVKEWADMVLFANYKTYVINVDSQGAQKGKNKVQGGSRVLYAAHHPCWDAKNRHGLPDEIPMEYAAIAHCIPTLTDLPMAGIPPTPPKPPQVPTPTSSAPAPAEPEKAHTPAPPAPIGSSIPKALADLMAANQVTMDEIFRVAALRGHYPLGTPAEKFDPQYFPFLASNWPKVLETIQQIRNDETPF